MIILTDIKPQSKQDPPEMAIKDKPSTSDVEGPPPEYTPSNIGSSEFSPAVEVSELPFRPSQPALAHLRVIDSNHSIRGEYVLDPTISHPTPPHPPTEGPSKGRVFPPPGENYTSSAYLFCSNCSVKAGFAVKGGGVDERAKSRIECHATNASVTASLWTCEPEAARQKLDVRASSKNASVTVYVPFGFQGHFEFQTTNGSFKPSSIMQQRTTIYYQDGGTGVGYISAKPNHGADVTSQNLGYSRGPDVKSSAPDPPESALAGMSGSSSAESKWEDSLEMKSTNSSLYLREQGEDGGSSSSNCILM